MREELKILYEDTELIVCHKSAGIAVQSAKVGQKDMVSVLNNYLAENYVSGKSCFPEKTDGRRISRNREEISTVHIVHRLDQPVEGVLVFAKTKHAAAGLSRQVTDGSMEKIYRAVCCDRDTGHFETGETYGLVDYLVKDGRTNSSFVSGKDARGAKRAELSFCVSGRRDPFLLAEIELKTGRHHQIRVQMAHAGLPLYGDRKYNERWQDFLTEEDRMYSDGQGSGKIPLALCAVSLAFTHPATGKRMTFRTEPGADIFRFFSAPAGQGEQTDRRNSVE